LEYRDELLILAIDLGNRLMPAFNTKTGIPYGTVNLRHGVPKGETKISSTAGAGSLFMEFHVLSILADSDKYGYAAHKAIRGLYERRSPVNLVGKHINIDSGQWQETMSGVGSNSDSFYEYCLKAYAMLHGVQPSYQLYSNLYQAVKKYILPDDKWFSEVDMFSGRFSRHRIENLDAFWPGLEVAMGKMTSSSSQLQGLYSVWLDLGFLPEELDLSSWRSGKGPSNALYPLRPELIEATVYHYQATKDRSWLSAGQLILESIQNYTRTGCGFASVSNIMSMELADEMPSFFLSETIKYLFLLFDEDNFLHNRAVIYSTEAHPFDLLQLRRIEKERAAERSQRGSSVYSTDILPHENVFVLHSDEKTGDEHQQQIHVESDAKGRRHSANHDSTNPNRISSGRQQRLQKDTNQDFDETTIEQADMTCLKEKWWEAPLSFQWETDDLSAKGSSSGSTKKQRALKSSTSFWSSSSQSSHSNLHEQRVKSRRSRQQRNFQLLQQLIVQYYDVNGTPLDRRPEEVQHIMTSLSTERDASITQQPSSADARAAEVKNSVPIRPGKCSLSRADEATYLDSLRGSTAVLDKMREHTNNLQSTEIPAAGNEKPLTSVELSLGDLGSFGVQVFMDAFRITRQKDFLTVDIASVGRDTVFVRQYSPVAASGDSTHKEASQPDRFEVQAISANHKGYYSKCFVELIQRNVGDDPRASTPEVILRLPCASSTFSRNRPSIVEADLAVPQAPYDSFMCRETVAEIKKSNEPSPVRVSNINGKTALDDIASLRQWFQSRFTYTTSKLSKDPHRSTAHDHHDNAHETSEIQNSLSGTIVLAARGQCLFEEKAQMAVKAGAVGLIMKNNENQMFMMAGKNEVEMMSGGVVDRSEIMDLPVVMLRMDHTNQLLNTFLQVRAGIEAAAAESSDKSPSSVLKVRIVNEEASSLLFSPLLGDNNFPKVWSTPQSIFVQTKGRWGAYLQAKETPNANQQKSQQPSQHEWQLYLADLKDSQAHKLIPFVHLKTPKGHKIITSTETLLQRPGDIYRHFLKRSCQTNVISVNPKNKRDVRLHRSRVAPFN
jgi:hypothetical protein